MRFSKDELAIFLKQGRLKVAEARILEHVEDDEPELMLYWAHRKRIRPVPDDVRAKAMFRFGELVSKVSSKLLKVTSEEMMQVVLPDPDVCDAIWNKLSDDERQRWLRSV